MAVQRLPPGEVRASPAKGPLRSDLAAIVLAAGAGRRFGGGKLTAPWRGGVLLDGALAAAFDAPAAHVVVVFGADAGASAAAEAFAAARGEPDRLTLAVAPDWNAGLSASLRAGLRAAGEVAWAMVLLGDMPRIPAGLAGRLVDAARAGDAAVAPDHHGVLGHPVLIGAELFPVLLALQGDRGARGVLEALGPRLRRLAVDDPGVLLDIDTREGLGRLDREHG